MVASLSPLPHRHPTCFSWGARHEKIGMAQRISSVPFILATVLQAKNKMKHNTIHKPPPPPQKKKKHIFFFFLRLLSFVYDKWKRKGGRNRTAEGSLWCHTKQSKTRRKERENKGGKQEWWWCYRYALISHLVSCTERETGKRCGRRLFVIMAALHEDEIRASPLWTHLTKVMLQVLQQRPDCALDAIVPASFTVQTGAPVPPRSTTVYTDHHPKVINTISCDALENLRWASSFGSALAPPKPKRKVVEEDEEMPMDEDEEEEEVPLGDVSDVVAEQAIFNSVGEGLQPEEAFRLVVGMKQLIKTKPLASVRFWGKFFGSAADYYIVETKIDPNRLPEEMDDDEVDEEEDEGAPIENVADVLYAHGAKVHADTGIEPAGTGLNEWVYYAALTSDPTQWTKLPDVTPNQIIAARLVRRGFTGDLESPVNTHPRFPGKEMNYLRAQIARISCASRVAPLDMYTTEGAVPEEEDDDGNVLPPPLTVPAYNVLPPLNPQEVPDEEDIEAIEPVKSWFYGYRDDELLQGKYWVHIAPTLLRTGRTVATALENEEEGDAGEFDHTEKIHPFLCDISRDDPLVYTCHSRSQLPAWSFRKAFHDESSKTRTYVARSGLWPGAFTYVVTEMGQPGGRFQSVYIGTGLKNLQGVSYAPQLPPRCLVEYPEMNLLLQRDGTADDELEYAPLPKKPDGLEEEEEEEEEA